MSKLTIMATAVGMLAWAVVTEARAETPAQGLPVRYTVTEGGLVSAAVYDGQGRMVRPLLYGETQEPGKHTLSWDGLDRYGQPQPPGVYEWRVLQTPGFQREFLVNVGVTTTWAPFDVWPGNHSGPTTVMIDEQGDLYVGSSATEGPPALMKLSLDGKTKYWDTGTFGLPWNGLLQIARIDRVLYLLYGRCPSPDAPAISGILRIRQAESGKLFQDGVLGKLSQGVFANLLHAGDIADRGGRHLSPMSLAGGKNFLVVTYYNYDEVLFLWPDGASCTTKKLTVRTPSAATVAPDGRVFIISGNTVVQAVGATGAKVLVRDPELKSPGRLAYEPMTNELLVNNDKHIRRYRAADGKLVAVYGRPEGRTYGVFNPMDFDGLLDIASDGKGGFLTVEQFPRRVARFRGRDKLELVQQWIGGLQWGAHGAMDPVDPTVVYTPVDYKHLGRAKVDFSKHTWTLTRLYDCSDDTSWQVGKERHEAMLPSLSGGSTFWEVRHSGADTFLVNAGFRNGGGVTVLRVDEKANQLVPVACLRSLHPSIGSQNPPALWLEAMKRAGYPTTGRTSDAFRKHFCYSWSDTNRNGHVEAEEIVLASIGCHGFPSLQLFVDADWNLYLPGPLGKADETRNSAWMYIPNEGREAGLPVWNWEHARPGNGVMTKRESDYIGRPGATSVFRDSQGAIYELAQGVNWKTGDVAPMNWPNNAWTVSRFMKWDSRGNQRFSVGVHTAISDEQWQHPAGGFSDVRAIMGEVKDCILVLDAGSPAEAWTKDGLYAGSFLTSRPADSVPVAFPANLLRNNDNQYGQVVQTPSGDVIWGCTPYANQNALYFKIRGWDNWLRQNGKLTLANPPLTARGQGTGLRADYFTSPDLAGSPALSRVDPAIWFGMMKGSFRLIPEVNPWFKKGEGGGMTVGSGSARWTGCVEAPLTEDFTFHVFTYGQSSEKTGAKVRLWVGDKLVIDWWDGVKLQQVKSGYHRTNALSSAPIRLQAGQLAPLKLEYAATGEAEAHLHLFWESRSLEPRHVPKEALYPD